MRKMKFDGKKVAKRQGADRKKNDMEAKRPFAKRLWDAGKKLMVSAMVCSALATSKPVEAESNGWATVWPGYALHENKLLVRMEGGASFDSGTSLYGFADFEPSESNSVSIDSFYGEARVSQKVFKGLSLFAQMDAGSGMEPIYRPGLLYTLTPDEWFVQFRASPWSFGGKEDVQLTLYASKTFGERVFNEMLIDANVLSKTIYSEVAVDILFGGRFSAGMQLRMFTDLESRHTDVTSVARFGVRF